jgi:hypothetical protein
MNDEGDSRLAVPVLCSTGSTAGRFAVREDRDREIEDRDGAWMPAMSLLWLFGGGRFVAANAFRCQVSGVRCQSEF